MSDQIETIGSSRIRHGAGSALAYLVELHRDDAEEIVGALEALARRWEYTKVCAKVPAWEAGRFVAAGFQLEAAIPEFYAGGGAVCFLAKYFCDSRKRELRQPQVREVLTAAEGQERAPVQPLPSGVCVRRGGDGDAAEIASLYQELLPARPIPLHDPSFILRSMQHGSTFFCAVRQGKVVGASFAETDPGMVSAEVAGVAVLQPYRGQGLTLHLLRGLEKHLLELQVRTVFSTTPACSLGGNVTFASNGYRFGGTLTNNENIHGSLESVNLWHKVLPDDPAFGWSHLFQPSP